MGAWNFGRAVAAAVGLVVATGVVQAATQDPPQPEAVPRLVVEDPAVEPAQFKAPAPKTAAPVPPPARPVADPPAPNVRIQVRVPADAPPGDDIKYVITVANVSQADAHQVTVRNPLPAGIDGVTKAEPKQDEKQSTPQQLVWAFGTLKAGQSKTIELLLKPKAGATEVKNLAYVRFEHGEAVVTKINRPAVKVAKTAPKQTVRDEAFTVRVLVENTGRVPAEKVRVVENVDRSAEVVAVTAGVKRTKPDDNQWEWEVGTLMPGERKVIEYRVTPRQAADALTTTNVSADKGVMEKAEARTEVLVPGLSVKLSGPPGVVSPGEAARYEVTVRNTGTLPSTNVRVTGTIPADCKPTMKTDGGQVGRDAVVWIVPKLDPGEARTFRYGLKAGTTGHRKVSAAATDARKLRAGNEVTTLFEGAAALVWETTPDPAALAVGRNGTFTVRVKNNGGAEARNVRVEVDLPDQVGLTQTTPNVRAEKGKVVFGPDAIAANQEATYTITYTARDKGQAWFKAKLTADSLGDRPVLTEKAVEITGGSK